ncbi:hypothetical protein GGF31_007054 [Allomyces arbusculus]|nr:hypothetical protein GGF31_007054 [Allomyces arbusculus]
MRAPSLSLAAVVAAATVLVLAAMTPTAEAGLCSKACDKWSPCCVPSANGAFCANQAWGCMESEGCDKDSSYNKMCTPRPMCKSFREDFNSPASLIDKYNYTGDPDAVHFWREFPGADYAEVENGNLVLSLKWNDKLGRGQGATIPSVRWMQYGTVSARIKTASGPGVVSSFITKTDISDKVGDEIDWEFIGANATEVQTNSYWNGNIDYTRGKQYLLPAGQSTTNEYHVYTIDWSPERIKWQVDGNTIRTMTPADVKNEFPTAIARVYFSVWDGGCNQPPGTTKWALGPTEWCNDASKRGDVKKMYIDWVEVKCATEDSRDTKEFKPTIVPPTSASGSNNAPKSTIKGTSSGTTTDKSADGATPSTDPKAGSEAGATSVIASVMAVSVPIVAAVAAMF